MLLGDYMAFELVLDSEGVVSFGAAFVKVSKNLEIIFWKNSFPRRAASGLAAAKRCNWHSGIARKSRPEVAR